MQKNKLISGLVYTYLALPFFIFAAGFLKWYFALPVSLCIILSVFLATRDSEGLEKFTIDRSLRTTLIIGGVFIVVMVLLSGIGDVFWQNNDHATRNTTFDVLVRHTWPPTTKTEAGTELGLVYYIGFWLPSAIAGKLFSLGFGYFFQIVWAVLGMAIIWYLLCLMHKKIVVYPLVLFLFFGGMDIVGFNVVDALYDKLTTLQLGKWAFSKGSALSTHIEWWAAYYQYSSHTTQLFWVFNQCLPAWIATLLLLVERNNKNLVFIMGLTLISSSLPFFGLLPIFIWCVVCSHNEGSFLNRPLTTNIKESFSSLFTFQNVAGGGFSGIISFLYFASNIASTASDSSASKGGLAWGDIVLVLVIIGLAYFAFAKKIFANTKTFFYLIPVLPLAYFLGKTSAIKLEFYFLFIIFEFVILAAIIAPAYGKSSLFYITCVGLLFAPFFKIGNSIDFCMRASIPLLVVLCLFSMFALKKYVTENKRILAALLALVLVLGAVVPFKEIVRTIEGTAYEIQTNGSVKNDSISERKLFQSKNVTGKTKDNVFYEVLAK